MSNEQTIAIVTVAVVILFALTVAPMMSSFEYGLGYGMMSGYAGGGMFLFMSVIWILVVIALVLFILWLIQQLQSDRRKKHA